MPFSLPPPSIPRAVLTAFGEPDTAPRLLCEWCWSIFDAEAPEHCPTCRSARPDASWPTLPYLFRNRYWFIRKLGRGGMGAVFLAYDPQAAAEEERLAAQEARGINTDKSMVAVKVVQKKGPRNLSEPQQRSQRQLLKDAFQNEIAAARMVARYSRLFVTAKGHDDLDPAYLAMEYIHQGPARYPGDVPWQTLSALLGKVSGGTIVPLPPLQVAQIGVAILHGIGAMAQHNIVHNDLKPDNVFVRRVVHENDERYEVKIMDLGVWTLDQAQEETESVLHGVGDVRGGTADYMSPEQTAIFANMPQEQRLITRRSDLHAASSVLWELVTGRVPFPMKRKESTGDQSAAYAERLSRLEAPPPKPAGMPEGLYSVLVKGLAKEPTDRWADAHEVRERLKAFIDDSLGEIGDAERALSALRAQIEPFNQLILKTAHIEERWRALKQGRRADEKGSARGETSALVRDIHSLKEELTATASRFSGSRSRELGESAAASSAPSRRRPVSVQPSDRPPVSIKTGIDERSLEEPAREKRGSVKLILGALLSVGALAVVALWTTGRIRLPGPSPQQGPTPSQPETASPSANPPVVVEPTPTTAAVATADPPPTVKPVAPPPPPLGPSPTQTVKVLTTTAVEPPPPPPTTSPSGTPKIESIKAALSAAMAQSAASATSVCSVDGGPKGSANVTVFIRADGSTTSVQVNPSISPEVNQCIKGIFMKIRLEPIGATEIQGSRTVHIL